MDAIKSFNLYLCSSDVLTIRNFIPSTARLARRNPHFNSRNENIPTEPPSSILTRKIRLPRRGRKSHSRGPQLPWSPRKQPVTVSRGIIASNNVPPTRFVSTIIACLLFVEIIATATRLRIKSSATCRSCEPTVVDLFFPLFFFLFLLARRYAGLAPRCRSKRRRKSLAEIVRKEESQARQREQESCPSLFECLLFHRAVDRLYLRSGRSSGCAWSWMAKKDEPCRSPSG